LLGKLTAAERLDPAARKAAIDAWVLRRRLAAVRRWYARAMEATGLSTVAAERRARREIRTMADASKVRKKMLRGK